MPKTKRFKVWQRGSLDGIPKSLLAAFPKRKPKSGELGSESFWARNSVSVRKAFDQELIEVRPESLFDDDGEGKTLASFALGHWESRKEGFAPGEEPHIKTRADAWHYAFLDMCFNFQPIKKMEPATPALARRFAEEILETEYANEDHPPRVEQIEAELLRVWRERGWLTDIDTVTEQVAAINVELGHTPGYDGIEEDSAE